MFIQRKTEAAIQLELDLTCDECSFCKYKSDKRPRRASLLPIIYFMGNRILLINFIVRMAAKSPFCLPSILLPEAMDKSGTPLRLMLRPPSFYQCPICQVLSSGLDGTWRQPKGVECGISKIANYNSSWIYSKMTHLVSTPVKKTPRS